MNDGIGSRTRFFSSTAPVCLLVAILSTTLHLIVFSSVAKAKEATVETPWLQWGTCELAQDPLSDKESLILRTCLQGRAGGEAQFVAAHAKEHMAVKYARGYAGMHLLPWLSLHVKGRVLESGALKQRSQDEVSADDEIRKQREQVNEYSFLRFGNPALSHFRLSVGHVILPFGLNQTDAPEAYKLLDNQDFWRSPRNGAALSLDDGVRNTFEFGCGSNRIGKTVSNDDNELERACSARYAYDISALEGTRLIGSAYSDAALVKRYGAAIITVNRRGDATQFEFVRRHPGPGQDFQQILRLGFAGHWQQEARWVFQFDDELKVSRRGVLAWERHFAWFWTGRVAIGYQRAETSAHSERWTLITGLEAYL